MFNVDSPNQALKQSPCDRLLTGFSALRRVSLATVSMYLGITVGLVAIIGSVVQTRQDRSRSET